MKLTFQIFLKFFRTQNTISKVTLGLSVMGVVLGVACLVVAMSVVSGVQTFIQESVIDLTGHYIVLSRTGHMDVDEISQNVEEVMPVKSVTPFLSSQGLLVHGGDLSGVMIHGLELETAFLVLNLKKKVLSGELNLEARKEPQAALGKELAKRFQLKVGDTFHVVIPQMDSVKTQSFNPKRGKFRVAAILDFGKFDYNDKVMLTDVETVQNMVSLRDNYFGAYVRVADSEVARRKSLEVSEALGLDYRVRSWWDMNQNFFTAAALEKIVIFIVILFIVIVASLNISSTLYIHVLRKFFDISILKTLGVRKKTLIRIFVLQGAVIAGVSICIGILVGLLLSLAIKYGNLLDVPGQIYNFDHLPVQIRPLDLFLIAIVTFLICIISSWLPARKGAMQKPVEGLRYESV